MILPWLLQLQSALAPLDQPGVPPDLRASVEQVCDASSRNRNALLKREFELDGGVRSPDAPASAYVQLGCARALLYVNGAIARDGPLMISGDSWSDGAEATFLEALRRKPDDARAAAGLSLLVLNDAEPRQRARVTTAVVTAVGQGVRSSQALKACSDLALRAGDTATSQACAVKGLANGLDSTWHLMRLARISFGAADTAGGNRYFDLAARAAHDSVTRREIDWHLQWFMAPEERAEWSALPDSLRGQWVLDRLASRDVRDGQPVGARLAEHFRRLEYVEKNFRMNVPRMLHDAARTRPLSVGLGDTAHAASGRDTTIFREYNRWQVDFDDQGVVWMRFGKPDQIAIDTTLQKTEAWRYDIDGQSMVLVFQNESFSGSAGATTLQAGALGSVGADFLCGLDAWRCTLEMKRDANMVAQLPPVSPQDLMHLKEQDREFIKIATTKDDNSPRGEKQIEVTSRLHRLWDPLAGTPIALVTYALKASDLSIQKNNAERTTVVDFDLRRWDAGAGEWQDTSFTRHLRMPDSTGKNLHVTGFLVAASSPGVSSWSLVATQIDRRRGRAWDVATQPLDTGPIAISDLVLGQEDQGILWKNHNVDVPLAPLNAVDRRQPVSLYYQVRTAEAHAALQTTVALFLMENGVARDSAALQVGFNQPLREGINEVAPTLDLTRLDKGNYVLEVRLASANGALLSRRTVQLNLY
jgi:hypothetical protein